MFDDESTDEYGHIAGDSILLIPLPEIDPHVAPWLGDSTSNGIDAHVTVLVPFLPADWIDEEVLGELERILGAFEAFDLDFPATGRFPEVLYLVPEPDAPIRALTAAVYDRWPQCPPYEGRFADPAPHLTVLHAKGEEAYEQAGTALAPALPLRARAAAVDLLVFDGDRWELHKRFPLR